MSGMFTEDTWGLSWSRRWHIIDRNRRGNNLIRDVALGLCGAPVYRQNEIRDSRGMRHLKEVVVDPTKAAGICKKCEKKVNQR